jgi:hypothetical protein
MNWVPGDCKKCILEGTIFCTECPYREEKK